jgi:hypothetical protein
MNAVMVFSMSPTWAGVDCEGGWPTQMVSQEAIEMTGAARVACWTFDFLKTAG